MHGQNYINVCIIFVARIVICILCVCVCACVCVCVRVTANVIACHLTEMLLQQLRCVFIRLVIVSP